MKIRFLLLFISISSFLTAQSLSGVVLDNETKQPIEAATIFFANTTYGTLSNADGSFTLDASLGKSELIISHISYRTIQQKVIFSSEKVQERTFHLAPSSKDLQEVVVTAKQQKRWRKQVKKFERLLFGQTDNAKHCKIMNPTVLQFQKEGTIFKATASDILQIENKALGYKIHFLLEHFEAEGQRLSYAGKPYFEELSPIDSKALKVWKRKRVAAYHGSLPHFLYALINNNLHRAGFEIHHARLKTNSSFSIEGRAIAKQLINESSKPTERLLLLNGFLQIIYHDENDIGVQHGSNLGNGIKALGHPAEKDMIEQDNSMMKNNAKGQTSYLFARKKTIPIDTSGYLSQPELLVEYGYWNKEGLADLVPRNFRSPNTNLSEVSATEQHPPLLGFAMDALRIPYQSIKLGGPLKDGIPSIDQPQFVSSDQAKSFLHKNDYVIGVEINGTAKAYPIRILNYHEIVNDEIDDEPITVTYCPLCASGAVFSAKINGQKRTFGVSGLLYNSDVLIYDRETQSLWSQILSEAIAGTSSGSKLALLPSTYTTFEKWSNLHPQTLVLSTNTGIKRDYQKSPYKDYPTSDRLLFPVAQESKVLKRKDQVIGIEVNGQFKAYSFKKLKRRKTPLEDTVNGKSLIIHYDSKAKSAQITDTNGQVLESITLYWFAWYAFHPDTELYK